MHRFIDRRQNPKDKNLGNRQRFLRRARAQIKKIVSESIRERSIADVDSGKTVSIPGRGISEPRFRHAEAGGRRERMFAGNKEFVAGSRIPKPPRAGAGAGGKQGADHGDGEDEFVFTLSREEFLDLFFEDLELPDLIKISLKEIYAPRKRRAGFTISGPQTNLDVMRTMRRSHGRRIALKRPRPDEVARIEREIREIESRPEPGRTAEESSRLAALRLALAAMARSRKSVPYIDPVDIRYRHHQPVPEPVTQAVMFCLMDVSGSMGEREKDLAKRFFMLLHLFLKRRYERIDVVFIRHTHEAAEVDEQTFFYSPETGGTVVSTALAEALRIIRERYAVERWNIYAAQASDGENFSGDAGKCTDLLANHLMPLCQYYAYVEILDEREVEIFRDSREGSPLWTAYHPVADAWANFAAKRIAKPADIYPVFRELFSRHRAPA